MLFSKKRSKKAESEGQGLVEYALILVLVSVVVLAVLTVLGPTVGNIFSRINNILSPEILSYGASVSQCQSQGGTSWSSNGGSGGSFSCYGAGGSVIFRSELE